MIRPASELAYDSSESAPGHVYVTPLSSAAPIGTMRWQVSTVRGTQPRWSADGKELFYLETGARLNKVKLMSVAIGSLPTPNGMPQPLFEFDTLRLVPQTNVFNYAPAPDGRFLINVSSDLEASLEIILNWATAQARPSSP